MGFKFRKSITIIPGVKLNIGSKSAGISIGGKYGGVSFNTRTGTRVRASVPGTGISFTEKVGGNRSVSKSQVKSNHNFDLEEAQNYVRIIHESALICKDTTNPEVFFSRNDLLIQMVRKLYNMRGKVSLSPQIFEAINLIDTGEESHIEDFIKRYFAAQYEDAQKLKTKKGQLNRLKKSYESLMEYQDKMDSVCLKLASDVYNDCISRVSITG